MGKRREASRPELMELSEWRTWETLAAIRIASARFVSQSHDFLAFRNPFRAEHELESGLPHRLDRQDASSRIPRQSPQRRLERGERVGGVTDSQTPSRFGGGVRGTLRRNIQFEHRIAWRRSAGGAAHHRLAFLGKDDSKRKLGMGRRLYHGATCLGERHSTRNRHGKTLH